MEALILAAGKGSRLGDLTDSTPKSMLELKVNETILENSIKKLVQSGVERIVLVTGFCSNKLEDHSINLSKKYNFKLEIVFNPFWSSCNVLGSLFFGLNKLTTDFIFLHADTIFDNEIIADLIENKSNTLAINQKSVGEEEMKVWIKDSEIVSISKIGDSSTAFGEFTGIAKFTKGSISLMQNDIIEIARDSGHLNYYMEELLQRDIDTKKNQYQLNYKTIEQYKSIEIDFEEDLKHAKEVFKNRN